MRCAATKTNLFQMWLREVTVFCNTVWDWNYCGMPPRPRGFRMLFLRFLWRDLLALNKHSPWSLPNAGECLGINKLLNERTADKQGETLLVMVPCGRTCFSQKKRPTKGWNSSDCLKTPMSGQGFWRNLQDKRSMARLHMSPHSEILVTRPYAPREQKGEDRGVLLVG